jgi:hypothetical protein
MSVLRLGTQITTDLSLMYNRHLQSETGDGNTDHQIKLFRVDGVKLSLNFGHQERQRIFRFYWREKLLFSLRFMWHLSMIFRAFYRVVRDFHNFFIG